MDTARTRHFLGWNQSALDCAAKWIINSTECRSKELDLSTMSLVVPGSRAARVLLGNLVDHCDQNELALIPPTILTPWQTPEALLGSAGQPASKLTQRLAWIQSLKACDTDSLKQLLPEPPEPENWSAWSRIGNWIASAAKQLSDAGLRMNQVPELGAQTLEEDELNRWVTLGEIQSGYEQILNELNVVDESLAAMDLVQNSDPTEPTNTRLILIGLAQLGSTARGAIEQSGCDIESLVFAPDELADRFDDLGCVATSQWLNAETEIDESRIVFESNPTTMCQRALAELAVRSDPIESSQCVIGLADESLLGLLRRKASLSSTDSKISIHSPTGIDASNTLPGQLLTLIQSYLADHSLDHLSDLVRHSDIERALTSMDDGSSGNSHAAWWLRALDHVRQDHVLTSTASIPEGVYHKHAKNIEFVLESIRQLLSKLLSTEHPLDEWADRLSTTLQSIYKDIELDNQSETDRQTGQALASLRKVFDEIADAKQLGQPLPTTTGCDALGLILDRLSQESFAENPTRDALETLGWLELPLDPAPVCIVVGMSESCVPGSITHDPLIPSSLRRTLGMLSNDDRLARDTYIMSAINASRDAVFICARLGEQGDPITPSRLLLNATGKRLANRIRRFVDPKLDTPFTHHLKPAVHCGDIDAFRNTLRVADDFVPPTTMSVTDFDAYLRSPALWYLQRKLNLDEIDTDTRELSPMHIGILVHEVLDAFGKDTDMRDLDDADKINTALVHLLDQQVTLQFGTKPCAAVLVQTQLLQYRLKWFAIGQAQRWAQGWRIQHSEWKPGESVSASILVDDIPMGLKGKIDRIDLHDDLGWAVIDYKTGTTKDAIKGHIKKDEWCKLQLPLYRHLVDELIQDQPLALGYGGLPSSESESVWSFADWNDEQLRDADEAARAVVREIRAMKPGDPISMDGSPPNTGTLGFIAGTRFDSGGLEWQEDSESEAGAAT